MVIKNANLMPLRLHLIVHQLNERRNDLIKFVILGLIQISFCQCRNFCKQKNYNKIIFFSVFVTYKCCLFLLFFVTIIHIDEKDDLKFFLMVY